MRKLSCEARQILVLLATGLSVTEAAERLGRSPAEIRDELVEAIELLGATSKLEAVIEAIRQGEIDPSRLPHVRTPG